MGFSCLGPTTLSTIRASLNEDIFPKHLRMLENILENSSTGWIANTPNPTIADFYIVPRLQFIMEGVDEGLSKDMLDKFPKLKYLVTKLMTLPKIVGYYDKIASKN